ncbi:hypothetical protein Hanom_Chr00s173911g01829891 [Helianthus anomalus]
MLGSTPNFVQVVHGTFLRGLRSRLQLLGSGLQLGLGSGPMCRGALGRPSCTCFDTKHDVVVSSQSQAVP